MLQYDFDQSIGCWINGTNQAIRSALNEELDREGITFRQFEVLAWLAKKQELTQSELADAMNIEAPTLAGILDRMEKAGWIDRKPCRDDKRRKRVRAKKRAEAVWTRMVECCHRVRARAVEGLSAAELAAFKSTLERIRRNIAGDLPQDETPCGGLLAVASADNVPSLLDERAVVTV